MTKLYDYKNLIDNFLKNKITVHEFERTFLDTYLKDTAPITDDLFDILDELFYWVDAYTDLPIEEDENAENYATEDQLRKAAKVALDEFILLENENKLIEK